jgi:hypothetical protein
MAAIVDWAEISDWTWDERRQSYCRVLSSRAEPAKYIWPDTYRPGLYPNPPENPSPLPHEYTILQPIFNRSPADTILTRTSDRNKQYRNYRVPSLYNSLSAAKQQSTKATAYELTFNRYPDRPSLVSSSVKFREIPASSRIAAEGPNRYTLQPTRAFRIPSPDHEMGYCDHDRCQDADCIETQYRIYGFRDDLRHHEDQDKNGNMKDGDNVGGHGRR